MDELHIFKRPTVECYLCHDYPNKDCPCLCHVEALASGGHESIFRTSSIKVEDAVEFIND